MSRYFDRNGLPMSMLEWARAFEDTERKRVALDEVDYVRISTVWLGLDHRWGEGPPLIFETLVTGGEQDEYMRRYSTCAEAIRGHEQILHAIKAGLPMPD